MEEINLLQNRLKDTTFTWQRQAKTVVVVLLLILLALAGTAAIFYLLNQSTQKQLDSIVSENQGLKKELAKKQDSLVDGKTFQAQLLNLRTLVDYHVYVSPLLQELSRVTYTRSQYLNLDISQDGKIHLEGRIPNYNDLGKLLLGLSTSDKLNNVKLLTVVPSTGSTNSYEFAIDMLAVPEIFTKK